MTQTATMRPVKAEDLLPDLLDEWHVWETALLEAELAATGEIVEAHMRQSRQMKVRHPHPTGPGGLPAGWVVTAVMPGFNDTEDAYLVERAAGGCEIMRRDRAGDISYTSTMWFGPTLADLHTILSNLVHGIGWKGRSVTPAPGLLPVLEWFEQVLLIRFDETEESGGGEKILMGFGQRLQVLPKAAYKFGH